MLDYAITVLVAHYFIGSRSRSYIFSVIVMPDKFLHLVSFMTLIYQCASTVSIHLSTLIGWVLFLFPGIGHLVCIRWVISDRW